MAKVDQQDNREIIISELQKYSNGYMKQAGDWTMVRCAFHEDGNPSMGVYTSLTHPERLGWFHCFGCDVKGRWNVLAERAGLQEIKEWLNKNVHSLDLLDSVTEESLLGEASLSVKGVLKQMGTPEAQPWPEGLDWRGFSGKVVRRAGGYIAHDNYNESIQVVFIVKYAGQVRGGVKALFERTKKGQTAYIAMKGSWVNKYGLLFFEQARSILDKYDYAFIVLVEGPRDALRLLINGIPAVAVLGASTMTKSKAFMITSLAVDQVYVLPDNDAGGETFWKTAKKALKEVLPVKRISLPKTNDSGKVVKIDPGSMSVELLEDLIIFLEKTQHFKRRRTLI